jgi:hypothetical protein
LQKLQTRPSTADPNTSLQTSKIYHPENFVATKSQPHLLAAAVHAAAPSEQLATASLPAAAQQRAVPTVARLLRRMACTIGHELGEHRLVHTEVKLPADFDGLVVCNLAPAVASTLFWPLCWVGDLWLIAAVV